MVWIVTYQDEKKGHWNWMKDSDTAINNSELHEWVEIGDNAGDDPGNVKDVKDRDGDETGGQ